MVNKRNLEDSQTWFPAPGLHALLQDYGKQKTQSNFTCNKHDYKIMNNNFKNSKIYALKY